MKKLANMPGRPGLSQKLGPQSIDRRGPHGTGMVVEHLPQSDVSLEMGMQTVGASGKIRSRNDADGVSQVTVPHTIRV